MTNPLKATEMACRRFTSMVSKLESAARVAVANNTAEDEFLAQARLAFRSIAGAPKEGRPPRSHGAWDGLIAKAGTQATLASWLGVSSRTLTRWMAERGPSVDEKRRAVGGGKPVGGEGER